MLSSIVYLTTWIKSAEAVCWKISGPRLVWNTYCMRGNEIMCTENRCESRKWRGLIGERHIIVKTIASSNYNHECANGRGVTSSQSNRVVAIYLKCIMRSSDTDINSVKCRESSRYRNFWGYEFTVLSSHTCNQHRRTFYSSDIGLTNKYHVDCRSSYVTGKNVKSKRITWFSNERLTYWVLLDMSQIFPLPHSCIVR